MVFPIVGGTQDTGYEISNAITLYSNTYLNRTRSSQSNTTGTFSTWLKMGTPANDTIIPFGGHTDVNNRSYIYFSDPSGYAGIFSRTSGSADINFATNALYRDPSAWYHLVIAIDTTQGTESNRFKMYVNGEQITSFSASSYPSQNASLPILNQAAQTVGGGYGSSSVSGISDGYLADTYYIDGTQYAASDFGETDDNGVWIPKKFTGSFGTNGFKLEYKQTGTSANASGIGADTSGNGNHLTSNNLASWVIGEDTPTNNFCTLNPLAVNASNVLSSSRGNTQVFDTNNNNFRIMGTTMPFTKGKWYVECKFSGGTNDTIFGFLDVDNRFANQYNYTASGSWPGYIADGNSFGYRENGTLYTNGNETTGKTTWSSNGDFLGLAIDADNNAVYAHVNGTYVDSGDPTSGASKTGSLSNFTQTGAIMVAISVKASAYNGAYVNFGNPVNNDSGVTNSNSDANGIGQFQYSVPSGYFAICSKNLAEFG